MKIKTKKEMNLPQFIAWAVDNHITGSFYANNRVNAKKIRFEFGRIVSSQWELRSHDTFTVEVEEQVDENTELTALVELSSRGLLGNTRLYRYHSINDVIDNQSVAFYILNDDQTMDLIWKNGKLVE